jgi:hypothetical protein
MSCQGLSLYEVHGKGCSLLLFLLNACSGRDMMHLSVPQLHLLDLYVSLADEDDDDDDFARYASVKFMTLSYDFVDKHYFFNTTLVLY